MPEYGGEFLVADIAKQAVVNEQKIDDREWLVQFAAQVDEGLKTRILNRLRQLQD